jgi:hypothetical protein
VAFRLVAHVVLSGGKVLVWTLIIKRSNLEGCIISHPCAQHVNADQGPAKGPSPDGLPKEGSTSRS